MSSTVSWNEARERLEQLLPNGLDAATWEILQQQPLSFAADELLWRVEAIARQCQHKALFSGAYCSRRSAVYRVMCVMRPTAWKRNWATVCEVCRRPQFGAGVSAAPR